MSRIQGKSVCSELRTGTARLSRCGSPGGRGCCPDAVSGAGGVSLPGLRVKLELLFRRWAVVMSMCRERGLVPGTGDVLQGDKGSASAG